jgi:hypothetical protein
MIRACIFLSALAACAPVAERSIPVVHHPIDGCYSAALAGDSQLREAALEDGYLWKMFCGDVGWQKSPGQKYAISAADD